MRQIGPPYFEDAAGLGSHLLEVQAEALRTNNWLPYVWNWSQDDGTSRR